MGWGSCKGLYHKTTQLTKSTPKYRFQEIILISKEFFIPQMKYDCLKENFLDDKTEGMLSVILYHPLANPIEMRFGW